MRCAVSPIAFPHDEACFLPLLALLPFSFSAAKEIPCDLDPLLAVPANWEMTPESFETQYTKEGNRHFVWLTAGYSWYSSKTGIALLEHNEKAMDGGDREFLRLRMARPGAKGSLAASLAHSRGGAAIRQGDLPDNLTKADNGDIFISSLPMVDQGDKGYCVVATVQRVFEYYGIGADMHQIAQIADADPNRSTSTLTMAKELDKIDYRFRTRLDIIGMGRPGDMTDVEVKKGEYFVGKPVDERKFLKEIRSHTDSGLPLL